jgi:predicted nucleic acid-binding protein
VVNITVINTSPLIFLSRAGLIDLLQVLSPEIIVPEAVKTEIEAYGEDDITAKTLAKTDWLIVRQTPNIPTVIQNWDLGAGESEVLAWGYKSKTTEIIVDDLAARRCAMSLNIYVRGTLGLVLIAKKRGLITQARPILEQLKISGMYLSQSIIDKALVKVGE